ncbi:hypothetical protein IX307_002922 [Bacteroides pyogenes]|nr:hypothetical protein [Bacteroides pyogenes]MBR8794042.1 hypothetical protein [Bacteroides pyogenes]
MGNCTNQRVCIGTIACKDIPESALAGHLTKQTAFLPLKPRGTIQHKQIGAVQCSHCLLVSLLQIEHLGTLLEFLVIAPKRLTNRAQQSILFTFYFPTVIVTHAFIHIHGKLHANGIVDGIEFLLYGCLIQPHLVYRNKGYLVLLLGIAYHTEFTKDHSLVNSKDIIACTCRNRLQSDAPSLFRFVQSCR